MAAHDHTQIDRAVPSQMRRLSGPTAVEEAATVVNETQPTPRRHVSRCIVRIKPRQSLSPSTRRATVILGNGGLLFLRLAPRVLLGGGDRGINFSNFGDFSRGWVKC